MILYFFGSLVKLLMRNIVGGIVKVCKRIGDTFFMLQFFFFDFLSMKIIIKKVFRPHCFFFHQHIIFDQFLGEKLS